MLRLYKRAFGKHIEVFSVAVLIFGICPLLYAGSSGDTTAPDTLGAAQKVSVSAIAETEYSASFFRERMLQHSFESFLDNGAGNVVYLTETAGDISTPDATVFSIHGGSYLWNTFYFDGIRIDDPWQAGNTMYKPMLVHSGLVVAANDFSVSFFPEEVHKTFVSADFNKGGIGGVTAFTQPMVEWFHSTAKDREKIPITERRRVKQSGRLYFATPLCGKGSQLSAYLNIGSRKMPDFDYKGIKEFYSEDYSSLMLHYSASKEGKVFSKTGVLFSLLERDNLYAEWYYGKNETANFRALNTTFYGKKENSSRKTNAAISLGTRDIAHRDPDFSRNIFDQDGEGYEPWYPDSRDFFLGVQASDAHSLGAGLSLILKTNTQMLAFRPNQQAMLNPIYMADNESWSSLYAYHWEAKPFNGWLLENSGGLIWGKEVRNNFFIDLGAALTLDAFLLQDTRKISPGYELDFAMRYQLSEKLRIGIKAGKKNLPYNAGHLRFFSPDYLNGKWYYWNDANGDQTYQTGEQGDLYLNSGGAYVTMNKALRQPGYVFLDIPAEFSPKGNGTWYVNFFYKRFLNSWDVQFVGEAEDYGHFVAQDDRSYFFYDSPPAYEAVPLESAFMPEKTGFTGWPRTQPYYYGNVIGYRYKTDKFFLDLSWNSHMITAYSAMGNGFLHNSPGVLSETMANPNVRERMIGHSDADRGYYAQVQTSYKISVAFTAAFELKWVDGQPFTKYLYLSQQEDDGNQISVLPYIERGNNHWAPHNGPREDGFFDTVLRLQYKNDIKGHTFGAILSAYNLFDFGTNLAEYVYPDDNERYVLELSAPRGLMFRLWMEL